MILRELLQSIEEIFLFLRRFALAPRKTIRTQNSWGWSNILVLQLFLSLVAGTICGIFSGTFFGLVGNAILTPLQILALDVLISAILFIVIKYRYHLVPDEKKIFQIVVIAQIPLTLLHALKAFDFPSTLVGLVLTLTLLFDGIPNKFEVPKSDFKKCLLWFYGVFFVFWVVSFAAQAQEELQFLKNVRPIENRLLKE